MVEARGSGLPAYYHGEGRDWHLSFEGALARAEKMRDDKLASMKRKMSKLQSMRFTPQLPNGER